MHPYEKVATENERFPAVILIAPYIMWSNVESLSVMP